MARRSDHSRDELRHLILTTAHRHLAERGLDGFSASQVAKEIGYSVATIHHVIGDHVDLVAELNTMTMRIWADALRTSLARAGGDRIQSLVEAYFDFAHRHRNLWTAIYNLRMPAGRALPERQVAERGVLKEIVASEIAAALPGIGGDDLQELTNSLIATVHGHCDLWLHGTLEMMGSHDPQMLALGRVREGVAASAARRAGMRRDGCGQDVTDAPRQADTDPSGSV